MFPIKDYIPRRHTPLAVWLIIGVNAIFFLYQLGLSEEELRRFFLEWGVVPARYFHPQWTELAGIPGATLLPLLTHMFLHGGFLHFLTNMWMLVVFADNIEDVMGPLRFLGFYLLCGFLALSGHLLFFSGSTAPVVGASGAIAGVMGAYLRLYPRAPVLTLIPVFFIPFFIHLPALVFLGIWFLLQFFFGLAAAVGGQAAGGVAWWAHAFGFLAGFLLIPLFKVVSRCYFCHSVGSDDDFRFM